MCAACFLTCMLLHTPCLLAPRFCPVSVAFGDALYDHRFVVAFRNGTCFQWVRYARKWIFRTFWRQDVACVSVVCRASVQKAEIEGVSSTQV